MARKIFVNIAVADLKRTMTFFSKLGFEYNSKFCDDNAACMIVNDDAFVMLLAKPFFKSFTKRELCEPTQQVESLIALSCATRAEVDDMVLKAVAAGGLDAQMPQDHGFMYARTFYDLDGHHWEVVWMDPSGV